MKSLFFLLIGIFAGLWIAWPGIFIIKNWKCFIDIIDKSSNEEISLRTVLAISPNYLLKGKNNNNSSKLRLVSDSCFR